MNDNKNVFHWSEPKDRIAEIPKTLRATCCLLAKRNVASCWGRMKSLLVEVGGSRGVGRMQERE